MRFIGYIYLKVVLLVEENNKLDSIDFDYYARYSYERLLLSQPHT